MGVVDTLVSSAAVGALSSVRAGIGIAELTARRSPSLIVLGVWGTLGSGTGAGRAEATFRDELLTLYDDAAAIAWREARRARGELGARTTPRADAGGRVRRHRVKA